MVVVWDRQRELAEIIAGDARIVDRPDAVMTAADVDAVVLGLADNASMNAQVGIQAALARKHVVVEQPIDVDPDAGSKLALACEKAGVVCAPVNAGRFADGVQALRRALDNEALGRCVLIEASAKLYHPDASYMGTEKADAHPDGGRGAVLYDGIATLDLLVWLFGAPVEIRGLVHSGRPLIDAEETGVAVARFRGGEVATIAVTVSAWPGFPERIAVHGMKASLVVEGGENVFWKHQDDLARPPATGYDPPTEGLGPHDVLLQRQYRNILGAMAGTEALVVTPTEAIAAAKFAQALRASAATAPE